MPFRPVGGNMFVFEENEGEDDQHPSAPSSTGNLSEVEIMDHEDISVDEISHVDMGPNVNKGHNYIKDMTRHFKPMICILVETYYPFHSAEKFWHSLEAFVEVLCKVQSDHAPIILHCGDEPVSKRGRPFRKRRIESRLYGVYNDLDFGPTAQMIKKERELQKEIFGFQNLYASETSSGVVSHIKGAGISSDGIRGPDMKCLGDFSGFAGIGSAMEAEFLAVLFALQFAWARVLFSLCSHVATSRSRIEVLPGFQGPLPFELETGYVGLGETGDDLQVFYYFIKSENNPEKDPLMLWLSGGPGCSSFSGLVYQIGPIAFEIKDYNWSLPNLVLRQQSWTKVSSIIFVDLPFGTGFSYAKNVRAQRGDWKLVHHTHQFLRKWLVDHSEFLSNKLFIGGDSYTGIPLPAIGVEISNGNEKGLKPWINLQGYLLGNPITTRREKNEQIPFAHGMGLISDEHYATFADFVCAKWMNDESVRKALHVREGTTGQWERCYKVDYDFEIFSSFEFHVHLSAKGYPSLIYSGDHDLLAPFLSTQAWIRALNYSIVHDWRSWHVNNQVAGYTRTYSNQMTFATVKGAGHIASKYKSDECLAMFTRWISNEPL
ncbi:Peptidase S10, serine carboxypeptidase [Sesbania bispinosa]|nr:Peptidase S10, serine carboxypeptidase [Sesbania bispinosa]